MQNCWKFWKFELFSKNFTQKFWNSNEFCNHAGFITSVKLWFVIFGRFKIFFDWWLFLLVLPVPPASPALPAPPAPPGPPYPYVRTPKLHLWIFGHLSIYTCPGTLSWPIQNNGPGQDLQNLSWPIDQKIWPKLLIAVSWKWQNFLKT